MYLTDKLNRPLHDLRISVIDRCNFRCPYCMPEEEVKHYSFLKEKERLTFEEITRLVKIFVSLGVSKIRITGGEPLLRPNIANLIKQLSSLSGIEDLALTTNGSLLSKYAKDLKEAGLKRITVSLDSLDARIFKILSGQRGDIQTILNGLEEACRLNFTVIKINVVVQRGVNDTNILDLVSYFKGTKCILRFIEYMDVGNCNHWNPQDVVSSKEIVKMINERFPIEPLKPNYHGEVASRYRFKDDSGEIGFISSISQPFCRLCHRARLSTNGKLFTCLFANQSVDLKKAMREEKYSDQELTFLISDTWKKREDRYSELRAQTFSPSIIENKVEMFQIGG